MACRLVVILEFLRFRNRCTALSSKCLCYFCLLISRRRNMVPRVLGENVLIILRTMGFELEYCMKQELTVR